MARNPRARNGCQGKRVARVVYVIVFDYKKFLLSRTRVGVFLPPEESKKTLLLSPIFIIPVINCRNSSLSKSFLSTD